MYAKCRSMVEAHQAFDSIDQPYVVHWSSLILGYAENGDGDTALDLFARMKSQRCAPKSITFVAALKACTSLALKQDGKGREECKEQGKQIHSEIGCHLNTYVQNTLVDMYGKCGSMGDAHQAFDSIKQPDVVSWTALILGYAENGHGVTALYLFGRMKSQGCAPNSITYLAALKACGLVGALESDSKIHAKIQGEIDNGTSIFVTCLVDFYSKCGSVLEAQKVFDSHSSARDQITWNALIAGYSHLGDNETVFRLFEAMKDAGFWPDGITLLSILTCCSHAGLVKKAKEFFQTMLTSFGITPNVEHYNCMVDILGRSNKLDDAMPLLQSMP